MDISCSVPLFGPPAKIYGSIVSGIVPRLCSYEYKYIDNESFKVAIDQKVIDEDGINLIVANELLASSHLAATTSLIRAIRWFEATWREYEAENLLGWAACCRSLMESTGDALHGLRSVASSIAEQKTPFQSALTGSLDGLFCFEELENMLIHFSHARKLSKAEKVDAPDSHRALQTINYIDMLEEAGPPGAKKLYSELCQLAHPSMMSLSYLNSRGDDGGFKVDSGRDKEMIRDVIHRYAPILHQLPSLAFNPGLIILRVLVPFKIFPIHPELRRFNFQEAAAWRKIEPLLKR
jgi:hypothetical protein